MLRAYGLAAVALTLLAGVALDRARGDDGPPAIKIGMLSGMFRDVPAAQIQAGSIPFKRIFREQTGRGGEIEIVADSTTLADRLQSGEIGIGVFHGFEFAWVRKTHPDLVPLVVSVPMTRKLQACLVVNKDDAAASPGELRGECVALHKSSKAHCLLYADRLRQGLPEGTLLPAKHGPLTPEEAMDAVVSGQMKAALVDISTLTAFQNNKPGAFDQLKVIDRSATFPPAVIAFRKGGNVDPADLTRIKQGLVKSSTTAQGRIMLMFWNLRGLEAPPANLDEQFDQILKAYPVPMAVAASPTAKVEGIPTSAPKPR